MVEYLVQQIRKKNYLVPDLKYKIRKAKKKTEIKKFESLSDFISMDDISKIIFILMKKKFNGF